MEMDLALVGQIVSIVLAMVGTYAAKYLVTVKSLVKELSESLATTSRAIEDGVVTTEELEAVVKEWRDVLRIFKLAK